jgi:hypothetical protein
MEFTQCGCVRRDWQECFVFLSDVDEVALVIGKLIE